MNGKTLSTTRADFSRLVTLARLFDGGRQARLRESDTVLTFSLCIDPPTEDGLCIRFTIGGVGARAWVSEPEWLEWTRPVLPVPGFFDVPQALLETLAAMTLAPWQDLAIQERQPAPTATGIEAGRCPVDAQIRLFVADGRRQLTLFVAPLSAPVEEGLAEVSVPLARERHGLLSACFDCYGGTTWLTSDEIGSLRIGDAVPLQHAPDLARGEVWVRVGATMAGVRTDETGGFTVTSPPRVPPYAETETETESPTRLAQAYPFEVRIGHLNVPLGALDDLSVGRLLDARFAPAFHVCAEVDGKPIGYGRLVSFAGRLAVRIEGLSTLRLGTPPLMAPHAPLAQDGETGENVPV